jgi:glutathione peroxidase-family protein
MKFKYFLVLIVVGFGAMAMIYPSTTTQTQGYQVGDEAIGFSLKNASNTVNGIGETVSFKDYKNVKGYIVIFTCNHCPFAKAYEDRIIGLHKKYDPKGYPVIAINSNDEVSYPEDNYANMKIRSKEKGFNFAYLHDATQEIAIAYGATKTPHVYLLEKKGDKNYVRYIGAIDDNTYNPEEVKEKYLENAIDALLNGQKIEKSFTRAVGCSIKWKN